MRNTNIMIVLPPALRGPGMIKSPPLDIANLVAILGLNANNNIILTDFRKNVLNDSLYYQERGINLSIFNDFKRCMRHFLSEDVEINRNVKRILSGVNFDGHGYVVFSVAVLEQFSLPYLMSALCLAQRIKEEHPAIKIIFFGNCPKAHIHKITRLFKFIDAFPMGGNEFLVSDYIRRRPAGLIKGQVPLDRFPPPDFSLFDLESYKSNARLVLPYELSRGCINSCFYCYYIHKGMINIKEPSKSVTELMMLSQEYGTDRFHLMDAAINLDADWLMRFCDLLGKQHGKIKFSALAIPNMHRLLLDKLKEAGCVQLRWGVESGSERMLKKINKGITRESIKDTLAHAHLIGINNYITLISGLECELESDVEETITFIQEIAGYVDSAKECIYGELGHFSLAVFESLMNNLKVSRRESRYKGILGLLNIGQEDIIDFMTRQADY